MARGDGGNVVDDGDELTARLQRANPVHRSAEAGAGQTIAAVGLLEEIVRQPRSRWHRRSVARSLRSARAIGALDPLDLLRSANPVPLAQFEPIAEPGEDARRQALLDAIVTRARAPGTPGHRLRPAFVREAPIPRAGVGRGAPVEHARATTTSVRTSRRVLVVPVLAVAVIVASAAGYVVAHEHASRPASTYCFASDSYRSTDVVVVTGPDALGSCEAAWQHGAFGAPRRPHLVACILPAGNFGYVGVFPGRSGAVCTKLNLSIALEPSAHTAAVAKLHVELDTDLRHGACVDASRARAIITARLDALGLAGWRITAPEPPSASRPCTTAIVTPPSTIDLVFTPRIPSAPRVSGEPPRRG